MKKILQKNNGITVCDSIVMSVREKRCNLRKIEAVIIAVVGYVSTIMSFLGMFNFYFDHKKIMFFAVAFSSAYIIMSLMNKKALWSIYAVSIVMFFSLGYKHISEIVTGYKYVYNVIYRTSIHRNIDYYKFLKPELENESTTTVFIFGLWLLALAIYVFTIYHPNSLLPLLVTFPLIEIGLYNGIEISVFWGMLVVAYWLAVFAMTAIDMGEYSGGNGGFVRKDNTFFPKRQMKLKVTEKCGIYIIMTVIAVTGISSVILTATDYKRSDEINKKRIEIRDAINSFSADDIAGSLSQLTSAFGFTFKVQVHKLGNVDRMKYKDTTDMVVTIDREYDGGALYLKEYVGSIYNDNQWLPLDDTAYNESIFKDFSDYGIYPQDCPYIFNSSVNAFSSIYYGEYQIGIDSKLRKNRSFAPYGTSSLGILGYNFDMNVTSKSADEYSYKFVPVNTDIFTNRPVMGGGNWVNFDINAYEQDNMSNLLNMYCTQKNLFESDGSIQKSSDIHPFNTEQMLANLILSDYENFVYSHYLQVPDTVEIQEVKNIFSGMLDPAYDTKVKIQNLIAVRDKVSTMVEYSLNPGRTPNTRDFVNYFLLENKKGYCTHYATTGVLLARMSGIPARYATGYVLVGDDFNDNTRNPDGSYTITLKDNRSHAWVEIYIDDYGWVPFEFTAGYTSQTIDTTPTTTTTTVTTSTETTAVESTETDETTTKNAPQTTTQNTTQTTSMTQTSTTTETTEVLPVKRVEIPKYVKYIIDIILYALLIIAIVYLRRCIIIYIRKKHFTNGSHKSRMGYIYSYAERILKYLGTEQKNMSYREFAVFVDDSFGGKYFNKNEFSDFMDIMLKSAFSESTPDKKDIKKCKKFVSGFAEKVYEKADTMQKIYIRFIIVLI